jgi:hypothetical protein
MSFELFVQCFGETKRTGLSRDAVCRLFPVWSERPESEDWAVRYDDLNWCDINCTSREDAPQRLTGLWVSRPCGDARLWEAHFSILEMGSVFMIWPNGPLIVAQGTAVEALRDEMIIDLGPPVYVRSGLEILECLRKT